MNKDPYKNYRDKFLETFLEKSAGKIFFPIEKFIYKQTTISFLILISIIISLIMANINFYNPIIFIGNIRIGFSFNEIYFSLSIYQWINDCFMALFFFIVGLELKRSIMAGPLQDPKNISLIMITALGGAIVPTVIYALINYGEIGSHGWAIPMATDTAFALGILAFCSKRVSVNLSAFLVALAIFDDIFSILIIGIFYTNNFSYIFSLLSIFTLIILIFINKIGITNGWIYTIVAIILWSFIHASGVHGTIAGILLAFTIPAKVYLYQGNFIDRIRIILNNFEINLKNNKNILSSRKQHNLTEEIRKNMNIVSTPLQRWEYMFINPVSIIILPLFVLFNAGIILSTDNILYAFNSSITWGIIIGLVIGKPLGIVMFTILALKFNWGKLPEGLTIKDIISIGIIGGIGFTMSIFIANLAFIAEPQFIEASKIGILLAFILSICTTLIWIFCTTIQRK